MVDTISTVGNNNAFVSVSDRAGQNKYWLGKNIGTKQFAVTASIPGFEDIKIMTPEEARKTKNIKIIGSSIASVMILTAAGLFLLLKGGPKGLAKNFEKLRNFMENQIQKSRLDNPENPQVNKVYAFLIKYVDVLSRKFELINNLTTLKDFAFKELMENKLVAKLTGNIHSKITRRFEKIGRQTVINSYISSLSRFESTKHLTKQIEQRLLLKDLSRKIEINGETKTLGQWLEKLSQMNQQVGVIYDKHFSQKELLNRYLSIKKSATEMGNDFNRKGAFWFWSSDTLNSFVAESTISEYKMALQNSVKAFRREISYSPKDLALNSKELIRKITKSIDFNDVEKTAKLRNINSDIENLSKISNPEDFKIAREEIFKKMDDFTASVLDSLKNKKMDAKTVQTMLDDMLKLRRSVKEFRNGKVEEILKIYEKILPPKEYKKLKKSYDKALKSLDKSINIETEDFFSKVRDLTLGSAPTDILTILGAFGTLSYYLCKSDNKQERQSVLLRYGFPALAGIGTSLFGNARLYAGSKSLFFGMLSSLIVGKIGAYADGKLQKYYQEKNV